MFRKQWLRIGVLMVTEAAVALAVLTAARQLWIKTALYIAGLHGPDATLYFTVGNAIRNGLILYKDMFDPKPPGMFLLSALSFTLFDDGALGAVLSIAVLFLLPLAVLLFAYFSSKRQRGWSRFLILQCALVIGLTLSLYNATIGGDWQTEFYGAFLGIIYIVAVDADLRHPRKWTVIAAALTFSLALLLKEPFVLTLTAASILLLRTLRAWIRLWVIPLVSAGALYIAVLFALGALGSYFTVYLPSMLGTYILRSHAPVWARGLLAWERIAVNVADFSVWLPLFVAALIILSLPRSSGMRETAWRWATTFLCFALLLFARSFSPVSLPWYVGTPIALIILIIALIVFSLSAPWSAIPHYLSRVWRHGLAFYLTFTAIGLGADFHGQYFALAIPFYCALAVLMLRRWMSEPSHAAILSTALLSAFILLTSASLLPPGVTLAQQTRQIAEEERRNRDAASAIDRILDACDVDRYYFLEERGYSPYAAHSPLNLYLFTRIEHIPRYHPIFFDESMRRLEQARIVVLGKPYAPIPRKGDAREECTARSVTVFLRERFTDDSWTCAQSLPSPERYILLYRRNPQDASSLPDCSID